MRYTASIIGLSMMCGSAVSGTSVATASSASRFLLRGSEVPVEGVPSWPVFAGDEVQAEKSAVILKFGCGSHVRLNAGTDAHVTTDGQKVVVHLEKGDVSYKLSKGCPVGLAAAGGATVGLASAGTAILLKGGIVLGQGGGAEASGIADGLAPHAGPPISPSH